MCIDFAQAPFVPGQEPKARDAMNQTRKMNLEEAKARLAQYGAKKPLVVLQFDFHTLYRESKSCFCQTVLHADLKFSKSKRHQDHQDRMIWVYINIKIVYGHMCIFVSQPRIRERKIELQQSIRRLKAEDLHDNPERARGTEGPISGHTWTA